jgi:hypothetical protein
MHAQIIQLTFLILTRGQNMIRIGVLDLDRIRTSLKTGQWSIEIYHRHII